MGDVTEVMGILIPFLVLLHTSAPHLKYECQ